MKFDLQQQISVILLAGGKGERMRSSVPKQYLLFQEKPVAMHSFDLFVAESEVKEIIVVCHSEYESDFLSYFQTLSSNKLIKFAPPGIRRQDSVFNGLEKISEQCTLVCVHDSARPLLTSEIFRSTVSAAEKYGAAVAGIPLSFTIKQCNSEGFVDHTIDRSMVWEVQTPQIMRPDLLKKGFSIANKSNLSVTDCSSLIELIPHPVKLVKADSSNMKVTTPSDMAVATALYGFGAQ